jgi:hypothetical protein
VGEDPSRIHGGGDKSGANSPGYPQDYTQIHGGFPILSTGLSTGRVDTGCGGP